MHPNQRKHACDYNEHQNKLKCSALEKSSAEYGKTGHFARCVNKKKVQMIMGNMLLTIEKKYHGDKNIKSVNIYDVNHLASSKTAKINIHCQY